MFKRIICLLDDTFDVHRNAWKVSKYEVFSGPYFPAVHQSKLSNIEGILFVRKFLVESSLCHFTHIL